MKKQLLSITALVLFGFSAYVNAETSTQKETEGETKTTIEKTIETTESTQTSKNVTDRSLRQVPSNKVCMANDTLFEGPQMKVTVNSRDYYGCCLMCKGRLARNREMRRAYDPLTGAQVDKATAIIGVDKKGKAYYFENEANLKKYRLPKVKKRNIAF